jgi:cytochrome c oxidase cbb3-type subunit 3
MTFLELFSVPRRLSLSWLVNIAVLLTSVASLSAQGGPYQRQRIDAAAATRGRTVYAQHCINCHGSTAKGTERGPDLIRSPLVLRDRLGNTIGPAITPSATHQAQLTPAQLLDVSHFLHQRVESIASNRNPTAPLNVLTGDPEDGRRYFNGAGKCSSCHSPTGDLSGIATRVADPANLQQRFLFPTLPRDGRRQVEIIVSTTSGQVSEGRLVRIDDFSVSLRDASGEYRSFTRGPDVSVAIRDPLAAHHELVDLYTDADMHNLTAYLSTLK